MGAIVEKCALFPAPSAAEHGEFKSPNLVWDMQPKGTPGGGVRRPFLWLQASRAEVTLLYFHANMDDLRSVEAWLKQFGQILGVNVLALEYPGYGLLQDPDTVDELDSASAIVQAIDEVAAHALQYLVLTLGIPSTRIVLYGYSLGSGPALRLAHSARVRMHLNIGGVVLQSAFISAKQVAYDFTGAMGSLLVPAYYDNVAAVRQLCSAPFKAANACWTPLLILHGQKDDVIAPYHACALYAEALLHGHPDAEVSFAPLATHQEWDICQDLAVPVADFLVRHVCTASTLIEQVRPTVPDSPGAALSGLSSAAQALHHLDRKSVV